MTVSSFRKLSYKMFGAGMVAASVLMAACGSSTTSTAASATATVPATCKVSTTDLTPAGAGTAAAPAPATITGSKTLTIDGSTALAPLFTAAQKTFDLANGTTTNITPNGSGTGLKDVESGAVQIGMSDIFASTASTPYTDLTDHQVAVVAFTLVVSQDISSTVTNLTTPQIKDIYAGNTTNWKQVGGPDEPITVVVRTKTSGTRATFDRYVISDVAQKNDAPATAQTADKTGELVTDISNGKGAIGYSSTGFVLTPAQATVLFPICIDGFGATTTNINSGKYTFWSYEHAYTKGGEPAAGSAAAAFLAFVNSADFQGKDLARLGFLKVGDLTSAATATHPTPVAGS